MHEFASKEFRDFFYGPEDHDQVQQYLGIDHDEEQAEKTSTLALSERNLTDNEFAVQLARRQTEIRNVFRESRRQIIDSMNYNTVLALAKTLNLIDIVAGRGDVTDTVISPRTTPIVDRLKEIMYTDWLEAFPAEKERVSEILHEADQRTPISRPNLPCSLDDALRYASNSPHTSWDALQNAFIGFLRLTPTPAQADATKTRKYELELMIEKSIKSIEMMEKFKELDSESNTPKTNLIELHLERERLKKHTSQLNEIEEINRFREKFTFGKRAPQSIDRQVQMVYDLFWKDTGFFQDKPSFKKNKDSIATLVMAVGFVYHKPMLAWIASEFNLFWKKHGAFYQNLRTKTSAKDEAKSDKNKKNGQQGLTVRECKRWLDRSKSLSKLLGNQTFTSLTQDELSVLIEGFSKDHLKLGRRTRPKIREFFGTLWTFSTKEPATSSRQDILDTLTRCGIKNVTLSTISKCLRVLGVQKKIHKE